MPKKIFYFSNVNEQKQSAFFRFPNDVQQIIFYYMGQQNPKDLISFAVTSKKSYRNTQKQMSFFYNKFNIQSLPAKGIVKLIKEVNQPIEAIEEIIWSNYKNNKDQFDSYQAQLQAFKKTENSIEESRSIVSNFQTFNSGSITVMFGVVFTFLGFVTFIIACANYDTINVLSAMMAVSIAFLIVAMACCAPTFLRNEYLRKIFNAQNEQAQQLKNFGTFSSSRPAEAEEKLTSIYIEA